MNATKIISSPTKALGQIGIKDITFSISTSKVRLMKRGAIALPRSAVSVSPLGRRKGQGIIAMNLL